MPDLLVPPAIQMRRNMAAARESLEQRPSFREGRPVCPAGKFVAETSEGPACRCVIEQQTISVGTQPVSLGDFCFGDYRACPTWRAEKKRIEESRKTFLIDEGRGRKAPELVEVEDNVFAIAGRRDGRDGVTAEG
jgi:hypothetical protein